MVDIDNNDSPGVKEGKVFRDWGRGGGGVVRITYQHALIPVLVKKYGARLGGHAEGVALGAAAARVEDGLAPSALTVGGVGG